MPPPQSNNHEPSTPTTTEPGQSSITPPSALTALPPGSNPIQPNPTTVRTRRCRGRPPAERGGEVGQDVVRGAHPVVGQVLQPVQGLLGDDGEGGGGLQRFHILHFVD
ncbi:hypothetical protein RHGRI_011090 [Rhododendron griersonianum]|uniref:Uncharacterized protein n=1 Tax=Rhododendron griersonianum TaxID=479676 RepID=A0AAV6KKG4_9ERIC|nr:hypothetical protein RHGRI_011090 [Rhododendron griersonianum]